MTFASGSEHDVTYVAESTFNTTPGSPSMKALRVRQGVNLDLTKSTLTSDENRSDRQVETERHGNNQTSGDVPFELSYGSQDDFIEAALQGTWAASVSLSDDDISFAAGDNSINTAGAVDFSVLEAGDEITVTGSGEGDNNDTYAVVSATTTKIVVSGVTIVTESAGATITIVSSRMRVKAGKVNRSFTVERRFTDISQFLRYTGQRVNTMSLSIAPDAMVTGSFGLIGAGMTRAGTTLGAPSAAPTTEVVDSFTGTIEEGGVTIAIITSIELSLDNGINPLFVIGSKDAANTDRGRSNLTGTVMAYFEDGDLLDKFINETESSIYLTLPDAAGNEIRITLPRIKYNGGSVPAQGEGAVIMTLPIRALRDSTESSQIVWERKPVAA
jgi:hypothetical protein